MADWEVGTGSFGARLRLTVNLLSQDIPSNTSTVSAQLTILGVPGATNHTAAVACSISGIGSDVGGSFTWSSGTTSKVVLSFTRTLTHADDGTLFLSVSGAIGATGTGGIGGPTGTGAHGFGLPTIPRIPYAFLRWDGTTEQHAVTAVRWDGTAEVPLTVAVRWDGTSEVSLL